MTQKQQHPALVSVRDLSQAYSHRKILKSVSFDLYRSEIVVLQGPNGAGKTTLFKVLCGLLKRVSGSITMAPDFSGRGLYLPESFLYEDLTLKENLDFYSRLLGCPADRYDEMIRQLNVTDFYHQRVRFLSRGQRVRGALCRVFLSPGDLIVLDEPLAGLDSVSVRRFVDLLQACRAQGKSILLSTHNSNEIETITDRWMEINQGCLRVLS